MADTNTPMGKQFERLRRYHEGIAPHPDSMPHLKGIDIYGGSMPLDGVAGGDHLIFVDFKRDVHLDRNIRKLQSQNLPGLEEKIEILKANRHKAGVLVADVSGHDATDLVIVAALHSAFWLGLDYELNAYQNVTTRLFDRMNTVFHRMLPPGKYITMIYGEISDEGEFRYISAAHDNPTIFSNEFDRMVDIGEERLVTFPPIGVMPTEGHLDEARYRPPLGFKKKYTINDLVLMNRGDILIAYTDGLKEHNDGDKNYFPKRLEERLRKIKGLPAKGIYRSLRQDILDFSPLTDDLSFVVVKKE